MEDEKWLGYNELAWIDPIIAPVENYIVETEQYCGLIREHAGIEVKTLLHLGSGAGMNDYTFKGHFRVTGVDISEGMLEVAGELNPEVEYHRGDMRTVRLNRLFDAVVIPESINYMRTAEDMRRAVETARSHLKPRGVFLFLAHLKGEFRENNFVYTGSRGDIGITVFENNFIPDPEGTLYEATMVYLVRRKGKLDVYCDRHTIGLFGLEVWLDLLKGSGFRVEVQKQADLYSPYIVGGGDYPQRIFICT